MIAASPEELQLPASSFHRARKGFRRFARNKMAVGGLVVILLLILAAVFAPQLSPYDPLYQNYNAILAPPSHLHLLGTDPLGRDVLSRLIYGARISLAAGIIVVGLALLIALPLGLISGYVGGFWDEVVIMRVTDAMLAFPALILALAIAAVLGPDFVNAMIALGISLAPAFIRLIRGQMLAEMSKEYVEAARAMGVGKFRQIFRHMLPNILSPILVQASLSVAAAVLGEASLSYLGLGTQPPAPSWGSSLQVAQGYISSAPWLSYWPGLAILVVVLAFNLFGDGLRDYLDPRLNR